MLSPPHHTECRPHDPDFPVGGLLIAAAWVVGSNLVTLTFVAGVCALWRPIRVAQTLRDRESSWMILSAALLLIVSLDGRLSRGDGLLLVAAYLPFLQGTLQTARQERRQMAGKMMR